MKTVTVFGALLCFTSAATAFDPSQYPSQTFNTVTTDKLYIQDGKGSGLPGLTSSVQGTGTPGLDNATWFLWHRPTTATGNFQESTLRVDRHAEYQGGVSGNTSSALWALCSANSGVQNYEWCTKIEFDNKATGSPQNVGLNVTTTRHQGSSPTWATNFVCQNFDNESDPTTSCLGSEVDIYVNGTDSHRQRHGFQMVVAKGDPNGATAHATSALWSTPGTDSVFDNIVLASSGQYGTGLNLAAGTFAKPAINLGATQTLAFDGDSSGNYNRGLRYQDGYLFYKSQFGDVLSIQDAGNVAVNGSIKATGLNIPDQAAPTSTSDPRGSFGDVIFSGPYIYRKTSSGWYRSAALSSF